MKKVLFLLLIFAIGCAGDNAGTKATGEASRSKDSKASVQADSKETTKPKETSAGEKADDSAENGKSNAVKNAEEYFVISDDPTVAKYFDMGRGSFVDYYLPEKRKGQGNEYSVRVRKYSWGAADTSYYREDANYFYSYYPEAKMESVLLPKQVHLGQKWFETMGSWSYEVVALDKTLNYFDREYKDLIEVLCTRLIENEATKKKMSYTMFYAKDHGLVASLSEGRMISYFIELKKDF